MTEIKQFILTKKIAKHGRQAIIVLPKILEGKLPPQTLVKLTIDILEDAKIPEIVSEKRSREVSDDVPTIILKNTPTPTIKNILRGDRR